MARAAAISEPDLPWMDHGEDRGFRWLMIIMLVIFLGGGVVVNLIKLPEIVQKNLVDVSPRLAQLILEKQKIQPPPPKKEQPKQEKKKEPEKKKEEPKKPEPRKPEKKEVKKESAREVAKKSGLIAMSDELADLREAFQLDDAMSLPQQTAGKEAVEVATASDLLTSSATKSSGGIKTDTLSRNIGTSELSQRKTTQVESKIESDEQLARETASKKQSTGTANLRSADQIERVFQKNKGSIFTLYNRALRKNPMLAGQVVVELTIAPGGQVIDVRILSSELNDETLERKLALRIKKFKFPGG
ncbi:MAG TPA: AgmX/PglI C-terminal domain-containing protein, partial [Gammaproteobacteria bacterium]|nr:AgmX/PglI C-terminal domain-containing protein [Gammaproteobacteria bacterium]